MASQAGGEAPVGGLVEGPKVITLRRAKGPALISTDLHGNWRDFDRLRQLFLASERRGEEPVWISCGDWVHGPSEARRHDITDQRGELLYDYDDETPRILAELFALMDERPGRVLSICGNHEWAHIGGRPTHKFHGDEAAVLEARMTPAQVSELRRRFASWPLVVRLVPCGVVLTHGAPDVASAAAFEQLRFKGPCPQRDLLLSAMGRYGFYGDEDEGLLAALSDDECRYSLLMHGHDREEEGHSPSGNAALLLCTSFGARQPRKTYAWLDLARRYETLDELYRSGALRRLWPELPDR